MHTFFIKSKLEVDRGCGWAVSKTGHNPSLASQSNVTNNIELAEIDMLDYIIGDFLEETTIESIKIVSDSKVFVSIINEKIHHMARRNFEGRNNIDQWKSLYQKFINYKIFAVFDTGNKEIFKKLRDLIHDNIDEAIEEAIEKEVRFE